MGKIKQRNHRNDEHLLGKLREKEKQLKRAHQRIRQLEKKLNYRQDDIKEKNNHKPTQIQCSDCGKGNMIISDIGIRRYMVCNLCQERIRLD